MALTHVVDSSVLTRLARATIREVIEPMVERGALARAGISDLEVGYSARSAAEWDPLAEALEVFELVETTADHVRRARQVQRLLASKHQRARKIPGLLIAAAAEARNVGVLHYNADFERIAAVTGQPCQWVVRAGFRRLTVSRTPRTTRSARAAPNVGCVVEVRWLSDLPAEIEPGPRGRRDPPSGDPPVPVAVQVLDGSLPDLRTPIDLDRLRVHRTAVSLGSR